MCHLGKWYMQTDIYKWYTPADIEGGTERIGEESSRNTTENANNHKSQEEGHKSHPD